MLGKCHCKLSKLQQTKEEREEERKKEGMKKKKKRKKRREEKEKKRKAKRRGRYDEHQSGNVAEACVVSTTVPQDRKRVNDSLRLPEVCCLL